MGLTAILICLVVVICAWVADQVAKMFGWW
jgi:hypothetical protein